MRLLEECRGNAVISYVYEPGSYVPLARLDADGELTEQGGLGTTQDTVPAQGKDTAPETIATDEHQSSARGLNGLNNNSHQTTAANDSAEAQYWQALSPGSAQQQSTLGNGTTGQATLPKVYYFHTDQVGMPQELANAKGQLVWQVNYKSRGSAVVNWRYAYGYSPRFLTTIPRNRPLCPPMTHCSGRIMIVYW